MNSLKSFVTGIFLWSILGGISAQDKALSFSMPDASGTLRLGIIENDSSRWLDAKQEHLNIHCYSLSDTKGFILEIENKTEDITLGWAFGGCDAITPETYIQPQYCKDNVFNVEGTQVTIYHGKVMQLKVTNLIVPPASSIRLSDGHKQHTPLELFTSGKKTDAPVLAATCLIRKGEKLYFCAYKQNAKADYADYMLPELFHKEKQQP
ncbi:DUF4450 domain-containing protein [Phocaeicola sp.]|uniref:DUF4450 domain-containing protein n=1 Tax=Phocaeicola sp. TaxID=2773926 RepID=UPI003A93B1CA